MDTELDNKIFISLQFTKLYVCITVTVHKALEVIIEESGIVETQPIRGLSLKRT